MNAPRLSRCVVVALVTTTACAHQYSEPPPAPLAFLRPAPAVPVERCEPEPALPTPEGETPAPVAEGALSVVEVRGDDRLALVGRFATAWSPDGASLYTATGDGVVEWRTADAHFVRTISLGEPVESIDDVAASPDGAWLAARGRRPRENTLTLWLIRVGASPAVRAYPGAAGALRFTDDHATLLADGARWNLRTGARTATTPRGPRTRWSPDGARALVFVTDHARTDGVTTPTLWDARADRAVHTFASVVTEHGAAMSADGRRVAVLHDGLDVFDTTTLARVAHLTDVPATGLVTLSHDGRRVVVSTFLCVVPASFGVTRDDTSHCPPRSMTLWDVDRGTRIAQSDHDVGSEWLYTDDGGFLTGPSTRLVDALLRADDLTTVTFGQRVHGVSPDGRLVLYVDHDRLMLGATRDAREPTLFRAPTVLARSRDGASVATLDRDRRLRVEGPGGCLRFALGGYGFREPTEAIERFSPDTASVRFSRDGATLLVSTRDSGPMRFRAFDARTGAARWSMRTNHDSQTLAAFDEDRLFVQGTGRPEVHRFDATTGVASPPGRAPRLSYTTPTFGGATYEERDRGGDRVSPMNFGVPRRDGDSLGVIGYFDHDAWLSLWDLSHPERVVDVHAGGTPVRLALSPDEAHWAIGHLEGTVRLVSRDGDASVRVEAGHRGRVEALAFSRDSAFLWSAGEEGTVVLSDARTGTVRGRVRLPLDRARTLWVDPDGDAVVDTERGMRVRIRPAP